jgi:phage major head subunit gpT-like protein
MAIINTGLLTKGLRSEFFNRFEGTPTYWQDLATRIASTSDGETYRWLGTVPKMREWGTGRLARGLRTETYSVENTKYEATLEVDRDEIADDQTGQIAVRVRELAQRAATHKDFLIAELLNSGETSGFNSYDGVTFFNDAHVSGDSGAQDNKLTYEVTQVSEIENPTLDQLRAALRQAITQMLAYKDDQGDPLPSAAGGLVLAVPPNLYFTALEAVNATVISSTTNVMQGIARVIPMPWLTSLARFYVLKTDGVVRPFIFQDREPVEFTALADTSEESFKREKFLYGVRARYRMAYGYWQYAVSTEFVIGT